MTMVVTMLSNSNSIFFGIFQILFRKYSFPKMFIITNKKMMLRFTNADIIANVALKFINHFWVHVFWDLIFKPKSITISIKWQALNDLITTFNFIFFRQVWKISVICFSFWRESLSRNSKQIKTSFLIQLSIKKSRKEFLYHIDFKNSISLCKVT